MARRRTSSESQAFLEAILANPDDDTSRLVYSDWLEEHDEVERAEFIRVQCELARIEGDDPRRPDLVYREEKLLLANEAEWKKDVAAWAAKYARFKRGFVAHVASGTKTFIANAGALLAKAPVTSASLVNTLRPNLKALAGCPHLAALRDLQLSDCEIGAINLLLNSPHAAGLRGLHFYCLDGWDARFPKLAPLFESPKLANLTRLSIRHIGFDEKDIRQFVRLGSLKQLEALRLQTYDMTDAAVRELMAGKGLANLRILHLEMSDLLSDEGVRALAEAPKLKRLNVLDLMNVRGVTDEGMKALAASPHQGNLTDLYLISTGVTAKGLRALIESSNLPRLARIDLLSYRGLAKQLPVRFGPDPGNKSSDWCTLWVRDVRK